MKNITKKQISAVLATALILLLAMSVMAVPGDANGDGNVNFVDAMYALRISANQSSATAEQISASDINGDGNVNFVDAMLSLRFSSGLYLSNVSNIAFVRSKSTTRVEDGYTCKYYVFTTDSRVATHQGSDVFADDDSIPAIGKGDIVGLTTDDLIDESIAAKGNIFKAGKIFNRSDECFEHIKNTENLGYVVIAGYGDGALKVKDDDNTYFITENTTVIRIDKSDSTAESYDESDLLEALNPDNVISTNKVDGEVRVFLVVEEDDDNNTDTGFNVINAILYRD